MRPGQKAMMLLFAGWGEGGGRWRVDSNWAFLATWGEKREGRGWREGGERRGQGRREEVTYAGYGAVGGERYLVEGVVG